MNMKQPGMQHLIRWAAWSIAIIFVVFWGEGVLAGYKQNVLVVLGLAALVGGLFGLVVWMIVRAANNLDYWIFGDRR